MRTKPIFNFRDSPAEMRGVWLRRYVAAAAFIGGASVMLHSIIVRWPTHLPGSMPPAGWHYPGRALGLLLGLGLMYLAQQLLNRKLLAWRLALAAAVILVVFNLVSGRVSAATLALVITVLSLWWSREQYTARSEILSIRQGIVTFCFSLVLALAYGTFGFWLMDRRDFGVDFNFKDSFTQTLREYSQLGDSSLVPRTRHADWFLDSLSLLGAATALYGLYSLFRPVAYEYGTLPHERNRMASMIKQHSADTEDYFKVWPHDKSYFFNSAGTGGLAYGVQGGVAMAVGGPAGPPESAAQTLKEFQAYCREQGWTDSYMMYLSERDRALFEAAGCKFFKIGEDAVIALQKFNDQTSRNKHFRNVRNRFEKAGYFAEWSQPPHNPELIRQLAAVSAEWLRQPGRREWRFFAGYFTPEYMNRCPVFLVRSPEGRIEAFVNQLPTFKPGWATIDLMRYRNSAPANVMDYLLLQFMRELGSQGVQYFNLGLAPMAGLMQGQPGPHERLLHLVYQSNQKMVSIQGLRRFKSKFEPQWEPKFMAYRGGLNDFPRLGYAFGRLIRHESRR